MDSDKVGAVLIIFLIFAVGVMAGYAFQAGMTISIDDIMDQEIIEYRDVRYKLIEVERLHIEWKSVEGVDCE